MGLVSDVEQDVGAILGFSKEAAHVYHDDASKGLDEPVLSVCVHDDEQYLKECCHKVNRTSARIKTGDIHCVELYKQVVPMKKSSTSAKQFSGGCRASRPQSSSSNAARR